MQAAGAIGMIVADDRLANSELVTMSGDNSPAVYISCAFATFEDGLRIRLLLGRDSLRRYGELVPVSFLL